MEHDTVRAVEWTDEGLRLLDQRRLPAQYETLLLTDAAQVAQAIRDMVVRGAPAIGITAAYGVALAAAARWREDPSRWRELIEQDLAVLAAARPTAVNLFWALDRMRRAIAGAAEPPAEALLAEARRIHEEDVAANRRMGELGAALIETPCGVLTHCNTGSLATGGYGTALGMIRSAWRAGQVKAVFADETRPWLQGARLTAWELVRDDIPVTLISDAAASYLMRRGEVGCVVVGADRVAANGDVANKIGTYGLAVAARHHGIKFVVVAPTSTIDLDIASGEEIPIETRPAEEVLSLAGVPVAAPGATAWNPAFDVTPAALVDALVTERGVLHHPDAAGIQKLMRGAVVPA
ncbi:S-methyl-5-thioribose-1-phosphate isomerase [Ectothiorhodospiraceae bacterium 2226]|nr:S-methyl-5-thioribose-1-phosphate isomerase [Ectothiorhodospiraceae bacterium 2226]